MWLELLWLSLLLLLLLLLAAVASLASTVWSAPEIAKKLLWRVWRDMLASILAWGSNV